MNGRFIIRPVIRLCVTRSEADHNMSRPPVVSTLWVEACDEGATGRYETVVRRGSTPHAGIAPVC